MAQFPIEIGDDEAINEAINYLLSGPSGLGQNFQGFSAYTPAYLRPSSKQPWSLAYTVGDPPVAQPLNPSLYLNIPISNITVVGGNPSDQLTLTFVTAQATAPFQFGDVIYIQNVVESGPGEGYNYSSYTVYSCTTTDVTIYTNNTYNWKTYVSSGDVGRDYLNTSLDTECNARVTVTGPTDQVFVTAQVDLSWAYTCTTSNDYQVKVSIARNSGFPSNTPGSAEYLFANAVVVSEKTFNKSVTTGSGTQELEAIFTTVLDGPNLDFGYYWYILTVEFIMPQTSAPYDITIGRVTTNLRSLTAQVIKQ